MEHNLIELTKEVKVIEEQYKANFLSKKSGFEKLSRTITNKISLTDLTQMDKKLFKGDKLEQQKFFYDEEGKVLRGIEIATTSESQYVSTEGRIVTQKELILLQDGHYMVFHHRIIWFDHKNVLRSDRIMDCTEDIMAFSLIEAIQSIQSYLSVGIENKR
ncbi:hypothetical protein [Halalkalibacter akibai]|uniref:Uncharacterized protein n=1 Tax=Halalkalibacter akibai (strain ATCC 43226 / DSM 21942 / CIP 109018 / JCM 9157 / 1139) TaxID=1236973 RepID=W4R180_HALA3|nr:hypothetical protein [Halalkalibacter akibai]GAE37658.1 hypothetical protein JCM9157_4975 [Halalkalibacter akibai JCM 9157]